MSSKRKTIVVVYRDQNDAPITLELAGEHVGYRQNEQSVTIWENKQGGDNTTIVIPLHRLISLQTVQ